MALFLFAAVPLLEWAQLLTGRNPSFLDVGLGWAGLAGAWFFIHRRATVPLGCAVVVLATLYLPTTVWLDRHWAQRDFPVLDDFSSRYFAGRWWINDGQTERFPWADGSGWGLKLLVGDELEYPGMFMADFPRDWREASELRLRIWWAPGEWTVEEAGLGELPVAKGPRVIIQIEDRLQAPYRDRFQQEFVLESGWNDLVVALEGLQTEDGRPIQMERIATWGFFFLREAAGTQIVVDRVELIPAGR